jgi:plastocyanin domain-containing protein
MEIDKVIVLLSGILISLGIYTYFLKPRKKDVVHASGAITITVDGGYTPQTIQIKKGEKTKLTFVRKDPSDCLEEIVIPDFGKKMYLPLNKETSLEITPEKAGEYSMHCGMNMFHGKIVVK